MKALSLRKEANMNKAPNCKWCGKPANHPEYREIDGITSKVPTCFLCSKYSTEFLLLPDNEKVYQLMKELDWFNDFADSVQANHRVYDNACEWAEEQKEEKFPEDEDEGE
jgi:hypothetical protein